MASEEELLKELPIPETEILSTIKEYSAKLHEFEVAVTQRDEVIRTLSSNLRSVTENRDTLQAEYLSQAGQLVEQVHTLQDQLRQAGEAGQWLHNQAGLSTQALSEAKTELLALRDMVRQKDSELTDLNVAIRQRDDSIQQLVLRLDTVNRDYATVHEESRLLRERLHESEASRDQQRREYSSMFAELRGESEHVEKESAKLALERLYKENEALRQREVENAIVVSRLMADVEIQRKVGPQNSVSRMPALGDIVYSKEEHDADLEQQLSALRSELDEMYGEEISRMKKQMREHLCATTVKLERELATVSEERTRLASQVGSWQQQYMMLSQQSVTNIDDAQRLNDAVADGIRQRQLVAELTNRVSELNNMLSRQQTQSKESTEVFSLDLEKYKQQMAEKIGVESRSLRTKLDELTALLSDANNDRDRLAGRLRLVESELESSRKELKLVRSHNAEELKRFESKAATVNSELTAQLAAAKQQIVSLQIVGIGSEQIREEFSKVSHDQQEEMKDVKKSHESHIEQLKADHLRQLQQLSDEYAKQLDLMNSKLSTAILLADQREIENGTRLEEMRLRFEQAQVEHEEIVSKLHEQWTQPGVAPEILAHTKDTEQQNNNDSAVLHLAARLEKVTRERDSAMHSLNNVYSDRVEIKQSLDALESECKELESERNLLISRVNDLDAERKTLSNRLASAEVEMTVLREASKTAGQYVSTQVLLSAGSQLTIPYSQSLTDVPNETESTVIDKLRIEFEELQRLRREKDLYSDGATNASFVSGRLSDVVNMEVQTKQSLAGSDESLNVQVMDVTNVAVIQHKTVQPMTGLGNDNLNSQELATMKQEYVEVCEELIRVRDMLLTLQRADLEREQLREHFESEVRLLRDALLNRTVGSSMSVIPGNEELVAEEAPSSTRTGTVELESQLSSALSRIQELLSEKDSQRQDYEFELEQTLNEHTEALKRIDALVQEHNVIFGGQYPVSAVSNKDSTVHLQETSVDEPGGDEDISPKRVMLDSRVREIEILQQQLHSAEKEIESLTSEKDKLSSTLESSTSELLAVLERVSRESDEQRVKYEKMLKSSAKEIEQLNGKLDELSVAYEHSKTQQKKELERLHEEHQIRIDELSMSKDDVSRELEREMTAARKRCSELQAEVNQLTTEKDLLEQECTKVLLEINREHEIKVTSLRLDLEQELENVRQEYTDKKYDIELQVEEQLNIAHQEIQQLKDELVLKTEDASSKSEARKRSDERKPQIEDLETVQVLHLRINDLTETKLSLQNEMSSMQTLNQNLSTEIEGLRSEREILREQIASFSVSGFLDTSGDSTKFETPSKLKKTEMEKELFASMVERLNKDREQLMAHLMAKQQSELVFETDLRHFGLSVEARKSSMGIAGGEDQSERRIKSLETEKELLAGMLVKLSQENERLMTHIRYENDESLFENSFGEGSKIMFESTMRDYADASCGTEDAFYSPCPTLHDGLDSSNRSDSLHQNGEMLAEVSNLDDFFIHGQNSEQSISFVSCMEDKLNTQKETDSEETVKAGHHESLIGERIPCTATIEHLQLLVAEAASERDEAKSRLLSIFERVATLLNANQLLDYLGTAEVFDVSPLISAIEIYAHRVRQQVTDESDVVIRELQAKVFDLEIKNEIALQQVRDILTEVEAGESDVPSTSAKHDGSPENAFQSSENTEKTSDADSIAVVQSSLEDDKQLLDSSVGAEKLIKELINHKQLNDMQIHLDGAGKEEEQTVASLIDQVNIVVSERNRSEELAAVELERVKKEHEAVVDGLRNELMSADSLIKQQAQISSSLRLELQSLTEQSRLSDSRKQPSNGVAVVSNVSEQLLIELKEMKLARLDVANKLELAEKKVAELEAKLLLCESDTRESNSQWSSSTSSKKTENDPILLPSVNLEPCVELADTIGEMTVGDSRFSVTSFEVAESNQLLDGGSQQDDTDVASCLQAEFSSQCDDIASASWMEASSEDGGMDIESKRRVMVGTQWDEMDASMNKEDFDCRNGSGTDQLVPLSRSNTTPLTVGTRPRNVISKDVDCQCDIIVPLSVGVGEGNAMNNAVTDQIAADSGFVRSVDETLIKIDGGISSEVTDSMRQTGALHPNNLSLYDFASDHGDTVDALQLEIQQLKKVMKEQAEILSEKDLELELAMNRLVEAESREVVSRLETCAITNVPTMELTGGASFPHLEQMEVNIPQIEHREMLFTLSRKEPIALRCVAVDSETPAEIKTEVLKHQLLLLQKENEEMKNELMAAKAEVKRLISDKVEIITSLESEAYHPVARISSHSVTISVIDAEVLNHVVSDEVSTGADAVDLTISLDTSLERFIETIPSDIGLGGLNSESNDRLAKPQTELLAVANERDMLALSLDAGNSELQLSKTHASPNEISLRQRISELEYKLQVLENERREVETMAGEDKGRESFTLKSTNNQLVPGLGSTFVENDIVIVSDCLTSGDNLSAAATAQASSEEAASGTAAITSLSEVTSAEPHLGSDQDINVLLIKIQLLEEMLVKLKSEKEAIFEMHEAAVEKLHLLEQTVIALQSDIVNSNDDHSRIEGELIEKLGAAKQVIAQLESDIPKNSVQLTENTPSTDQFQSIITELTNKLDLAEQRNVQLECELSELSTSFLQRADELKDVVTELSVQSSVLQVSEVAVEEMTSVVSNAKINGTSELSITVVECKPDNIEVEQDELKPAGAMTTAALNIRISELESSLKASKEQESCQADREIFLMNRISMLESTVADLEKTRPSDELLCVDNVLTTSEASNDSTAASLDNLTAQLGELRAENRELKEKSASSRKHIQDTELKYKASVKKREKIASELAEASKKISELEDMHKRSSTNVDSLENEIACLKTEQARLETVEKGVTLVADELKQVNSELHGRVLSVDKEYKDLESKYSSLSSEKNELMSENIALKIAFEKYKVDYDEALASKQLENVGLQDKLTASLSECKRLSEELTDAVKSGEDFRKQFSEVELTLQARIDELMEEISKRKDEQLNLVQQCSVYEIKVGELSIQLQLACRSQQEEFERLSGELSVMKGNTEHLTQEGDLSALENTSLKSELAAVHDEYSQLMKTLSSTESEYAEFKERENAERLLQVEQLESLRYQLSSIQNEKSLLSDEVEELQKNNSSFQSMLEEKESKKTDQHEKGLEILESERSGLLLELSSVKDENDELKAKLEAMDASLNLKNELERDTKDIKCGQKALEQELSSKNMENDNLKALLEEIGSTLNLKINELETNTNTYMSERDSLEQELLSTNNKYDKLKAKLDEVSTSFSLKITELESDLAASKADRDSLEQVLSSTRDERDKLKAKLEEVSSSLSLKISDLETNLAASKADRDSLEQVLSSTRDERDKLKAKLEEVSSSLSLKISELETDLAASKADRDSLEQVLSSTRDERDKLKAKLEEVSSSLSLKISDLETDLAASKTDRDSLEQVLSSTRDERDKLKAKLEEVSSSSSLKISELETNLAAFKSEQDDLELELASIRDENADLKKIREELSQSVADQVSKLTNELCAVKTDQDKQVGELTGKESRIESLTTELDSLKGERRGFEEQLLVVQNRYEELSAAYAELQTERDSFSSNFAAIKLELELHKQLQADLNQMMSHEESQLRLVQEECNRLTQELSREIAKNNEIQTCHLDVEAQLTFQASELVMLTNERDEIAKKLSVVEESATALKLQLQASSDSLNDEIKHLKDELQALVDEKGSLLNFKSMAEQQLLAAERDINQLKKSVTDLTAAKDKSESSREALEWECAQLRLQLEQSNSNVVVRPGVEEDLGELQKTAGELLADHKLLLSENVQLKDEIDRLTKELNESVSEKMHTTQDESSVSELEAIIGKMLINLQSVQLENTKLRVEADGAVSLMEELNVVRIELEAHKKPTTEQLFSAGNDAMPSERKTVQDITESTSTGERAILQNEEAVQEVIRLRALVDEKTRAIDFLEKSLALKQEKVSESESKASLLPAAAIVKEHNILLSDIHHIEVEPSTVIDWNKLDLHGSMTSQKVISKESITLLEAAMPLPLEDMQHPEVGSGEQTIRELTGSDHFSGKLEQVDRSLPKTNSTNVVSNVADCAVQYENQLVDLSSRLHSTQRELDAATIALEVMKKEQNTAGVLNREALISEVTLSIEQRFAKELDTERLKLSVCTQNLSSCMLQIQESSAKLEESLTEREHLKVELQEKRKLVEDLHERISMLTDDNRTLTGQAEFMGLGLAADDSLVDDKVVAEFERYKRLVSDLENQLLMASEENERLHTLVDQHRLFVSGGNSNGLAESHQDFSNELLQERNQHATEMKVLEYRLQEAHSRELSKLRSKIESELESVYQDRNAALENKYRTEIDQVRKDLERKFLEEFQKMRRDFNSSQVSDDDMPGDEHTVPEQLKHLITGLHQENQDLAHTRQCLISELDAFRHRVEALQEENLHLMSECDRLSAAALQPQSRSAVTGSAENDADGTDWRILEDQNLRLQSMPGADVSTSGVVDNGFVVDSDIVFLQQRVDELERENRAMYARCRAFERSPGNDSVASSEQDGVDTGYIDERLRREIAISASASRLEANTFTFQSSEISPKFSQRLDLFIHEDRDSDASPSSCYDGSYSGISSPTSFDGAYPGVGSPDIEHIRAEFDAYKGKSKNNYAKLKARLVATVREFNEYKVSHSFTRMPSPMRSSASPTFTNVYVLQSENVALRSKIDELISLSSGHPQLPEVRLQTDQEIQTIICGDLPKVTHVDDRCDDDGIVIQATVVDVFQTTSEMVPLNGAMQSSSSEEKLADVLLELQVVQSECALLKQQNASLEQLVSHFKSAADKRERWVDHQPAEVPTVDHVEVAATLDSSSEPNIPLSPGVDDRRNLVVENRRLRREWKMERGSYEKKLQILKECCDELRMVKTAEVSVMEKSEEDCQRCVELSDRCQKWQAKAAEAEQLLKVMEPGQRRELSEEHRSAADDSSLGELINPSTLLLHVFVVIISLLCTVVADYCRCPRM